MCIIYVPPPTTRMKVLLGIISNLRRFCFESWETFCFDFRSLKKSYLCERHYKISKIWTCILIAHNSFYIIGFTNSKWGRKTFSAPALVFPTAHRRTSTQFKPNLISEYRLSHPTSRGEFFSSSLQVYITWDSSTLACPNLSFNSVSSLLCITTQTTDCYWSEESFLSLIGHQYRYPSEPVFVTL